MGMGHSPTQSRAYNKQNVPKQNNIRYRDTILDLQSSNITLNLQLEIADSVITRETNDSDFSSDSLFFFCAER